MKSNDGTAGTSQPDPQHDINVRPQPPKPINSGAGMI